MDRRLRPAVVLACIAFVTACAPAPESDVSAAPASASASTEDAGLSARADAPRAADAIATPAVAAPTSGTAAGRWLLQESDPPRAVWGVPASVGMLAFSCDRANGQLVLERQAVGVPEHVRLVSIDADGTRMDYPAKRVDATLAPLLVTPIALDAPILDRMLIARAVVVTAGTDAIATVAPGASLQAVVDACRSEAAG